jgi:hypothetical protein
MNTYASSALHPERRTATSSTPRLSQREAGRLESGVAEASRVSS